MSDRKPVILVADDQDNMRTLLTRVLSLEEYGFEMAASGKRAIEVLETTTIDLALLDIYMPGIDGIGVVEFMKSKPELAKIPIVMITGQVDTSSVLRCKALGVNDYLIKPYKISALLGRIEAALQRVRDGE